MTDILGNMRSADYASAINKALGNDVASSTPRRRETAEIIRFEPRPTRTPAVERDFKPHTGPLVVQRADHATLLGRSDPEFYSHVKYGAKLAIGLYDAPFDTMSFDKAPQDVMTNYTLLGRKTSKAFYVHAVWQRETDHIFTDLGLLYGYCKGIPDCRVLDWSSDEKTIVLTHEETFRAAQVPEKCVMLPKRGLPSSLWFNLAYFQ